MLWFALLTRTPNTPDCQIRKVLAVYYFSKTILQRVSFFRQMNCTELQLSNSFSWIWSYWRVRSLVFWNWILTVLFLSLVQCRGHGFCIYQHLAFSHVLCFLRSKRSTAGWLQFCFVFRYCSFFFFFLYELKDKGNSASLPFSSLIMSYIKWSKLKLAGLSIILFSGINNLLHLDSFFP